MVLDPDPWLWYAMTGITSAKIANFLEEKDKDPDWQPGAPMDSNVQ